ncbi:porin [Noviherbaspirillum saxi]|uniref:Porin n=2 Tax=Noviherbaspirillum saxi TaxID=2320863 RepID=A0A3A3FJK7_9BURK|nr:porin [Noviherbaspirillum saxi]
MILTVAGALLPAFAFAQTSVTVYGRLDVSIDHEKTQGRSSLTEQADNASRLGFKGVEDLGSGFKAVFGAEYGFDAGTGAFSTATNPFRNTYVGFTGGFGAVAFGRLDSANPTGSPLYSQVTKNVDFVVHDAGATAIGTSVLRARNRVSNAFGYMSPTYGGFNVRARYYLSGAAPAAIPGVAQEDDMKQFDIGLNYEQGPFTAGIGYGKDSKSAGFLANDFKNKWQAVASYDFGFINTYGFYGHDNHHVTTPTRRSSVDYWLVGVSAPFGGNNRVIANYMQKDVQSDRNGKLKRLQFGVSHGMSKRTSLYALADVQDPNSNVANNKIRVVSAGIQHNF